MLPINELPAPIGPNHRRDFKDKVVAEIGCGGGWYLAEMLYQGATKAIGFEASRTVIERATQALQKLKLTAYEFREVDGRYLDVLPEKSVDILLEITVFQHISEDATKGYFRTSRRVLKNSGLFLCQFLMNDKNPLKDPYNPKEGTVYYAHKEVMELAEDHGLRVSKYGDWKWTDGKGSYWRLYVMTPNEARASAKA